MSFKAAEMNVSLVSPKIYPFSSTLGSVTQTNVYVHWRRRARAPFAGVYMPVAVSVAMVCAA